MAGGLSVIASVRDDLISDGCYDNMSDVHTSQEGYSFPVNTENVVARSKSSRSQHKCLHARPSQFPALEVYTA